MIYAHRVSDDMHGSAVIKEDSPFVNPAPPYKKGAPWGAFPYDEKCSVNYIFLYFLSKNAPEFFPQEATGACSEPPNKRLLTFFPI